jgi:hypothetical protein
MGGEETEALSVGAAVAVRDDGPSHRRANGTAHARRTIPGAVLPDLWRLYAFVLVAEELHFRRAAQRMMMAQSPLSRIIKGLERDLGVALFMRTHRSVRLTSAGDVLLEDARELLTRTGRMVRRLQESANSQTDVPP